MLISFGWRIMQTLSSASGRETFSNFICQACEGSRKILINCKIICNVCDVMKCLTTSAGLLVSYKLTRVEHFVCMTRKLNKIDYATQLKFPSAHRSILSYIFYFTVNDLGSVSLLSSKSWSNLYAICLAPNSRYFKTPSPWQQGWNELSFYMFYSLTWCSCHLLSSHLIIFNQKQLCGQSHFTAIGNIRWFKGCYFCKLIYDKLYRCINLMYTCRLCGIFCCYSSRSGTGR